MVNCLRCLTRPLIRLGIQFRFTPALFSGNFYKSLLLVFVCSLQSTEQFLLKDKDLKKS